ncbi:hypothetical protein [Nitrosomonas sp.]|uniref:hypothetical protein n=1 Tax=Nitrosomonas sp. TaxID=42353 RepID=UPI00262F4FFD|nr:hypothetical protein [Nitrosomonas sp.]MCW5601400.1 hypothetical protein [Nitrosomonas sp.]
MNPESRNVLGAGESPGVVRRLPPGGRGVARCGVVAGGHDYPQPAPLLGRLR